MLSTNKRDILFLLLRITSEILLCFSDDKPDDKSEDKPEDKSEDKSEDKPKDKPDASDKEQKDMRTFLTLLGKEIIEDGVAFILSSIERNQ